MTIKKFTRFFFLLLAFYLLPIMLFSDDIKKADKLYRQLDYKYALEIYEKIMQSNPSMGIAERIASCYRLMNNTEAAEIWYKKVIEYPESEASNYKYCADALKQNGKYDEAASYYSLWGNKDSQYKAEAQRQANMCEVAKTWALNPDIGAKLENTISFNSSNSDFSPTRIGNQLYFVSDRFQNGNKKEKIFGWTGNPYLKIYVSDITSQAVDLLEGNINKGYHSGPMAFYPSADTLIFTRAIPPSANDKTTHGKQMLILAVKKKNKWLEKSKLTFDLKSKFSMQHPALSPDGQVLYFVSDMPGGFGGMDLYFSEKQADGTWSKPQNCGKEVNTPMDEAFPSVRQDGKFYFASSGHIGMGGLDIFSADGDKNSFKNVENLRAPINSPKDDFGIVFNDDLKTGYLSSNRTGGVGLDDIYKFTIGIKAEPKKELLFAVNGMVVEKGSNNPIADVEVLLINSNTGAERKIKSDAQGLFKFDLDKETDYIIRGNPLQYFTSQSGNISTKGAKQSTLYEVRFELERSKDVFTVKLNNIFYDFNKWNIRADAVADLEKVNKFLADMPTVGMELLAHTDSRGSAKYNMALSQKRANSAKDYLVNAGTAADRLNAIGKGETELLNQCADGVKCTAIQHQQNRRTEFKIVKVAPVLALAQIAKK